MSLHEGVRLRSDVLGCARSYLLREGFIEICTPKISGMPTDQDDHLFRTTAFGNEAYLVQSPQFYKQAYVVNGIDSVFEVAPVFRAEPRVTTRHLSEFTSLDIESKKFHSVEDIVRFEQGLMRALNDVTKSPIEGFEVVSYSGALKLLGAARIGPEEERELVARIGKEGVFITGYPASQRAFYYDAVDGISQSFDLIVRGLEITSGGIRCNDQDRLLASMREQGIDASRYQPYLRLFDKRVPTHGGFAIGIERLITRYLHLDDVGAALPYCRKPNTREESLLW